MKKTFTILTVALMLLAMFTSPMRVMGQTRADEVYSTCLFGSSYNSTSIGDYTSTWTTTNEGFTWTIVNGNNNQNAWSVVKFGRKNNASVGSITTAAKYSSAVTKVNVTIDALTASKINSITLYTSSDNSTWTTAGTFTKATGTQSVSISSPAANLYYKVEFNCASGSSNGLITVSKVEYYIAGATPTCVQPTFSIASGAYTSTQSVELSTTTSGATIHYTTDGTDPTASSSVYNSAIPVSSTTTIKAIAMKSGYDNSSIASATYAIVDHAGTADDPYTVADALVVINAGVGMTDVYATGIVKTIPYAYTSNNGITFNMVDNIEDTDFLQAYKCTGTDAPNVVVNDVAVVHGNLTYFNNTTYEFTQGCTLVSLTHASGTVLDPVFTPAAGGYSTTKTVEITCATEGATIYYTTNGNDPTTSSSVYSSAITVSSNTTIKAVAYLNSNHSEIVTANYQLLTDNNTTVRDVAYALTNYPLTGVFVRGIVCTAPTQDPTNNGELTYYISADGTETDRLEVYKGRNIDNTAFAYQTDINVGDNVIIYGNVVDYNSTIEFKTGNYLVSLSTPINPSITIAASELTVNADAHNNATIDVTYQDIATGAVAPTISFYESDGTTTATYSWFETEFDSNYDITYTVSANDGAARTAYFKISATDDDGNPYTSELFAFTQAAPVVDYATLPFSFDGGRADIENTDGLTQNGLDSDYSSSPKLKFKNEGTYVILHFNEAPGELTFDIKGNSISGAHQFDVMTSTDGTTYSAKASYTSVANTTESKTINDLGSDVRYIKWIYTTKSSGNVGLGNISLAKPSSDPVIVADNSVELEYNETSGSISYSITNPTSATLTASTDADWISNITVGESTVTFSATTNEGSADRTATITLSYTGATDKTVTVTQGHYVAPFTPTTYTLATSIVSGKTYIITNGSNKAMGVQNSNNRAAVSVTIDGSTTTVETDDVYEFVISTDAEDSSLFNIYDAVNDGYLYAAGGTSSNYLRTKSDIDATGQWNISIDSEGVASIVANFDGSKADPRNTMKYNSNNDIFSCYASGQNDIYLYEKDEVPTTATYYYSVNGTLSEAYTCAIGSTKTLETGTDLYSNFTFAGWTTAAHDVSSPISSYTFADQGPVTFYAVYAHNSNYYTRVFNETATSDIIIYGPAIIPSFATLDMGVYNLDYYMAPLVYIPYILIEEGGQMIYHDDIIKMVIQKNINAPTGTWGEDDNTGWYTFSSPNGYWSKLSEYDDFTLPAVGGVRQYDLYAYAENFGWYNKKDGSYINCIDEGVGYLYARAQSIMFNLSGESYNDDVDLTNLSYTSRMGALAGLHCIGNPYTHNIYKGVGITGDMAANYYALNEATGAWISTTDATPITPMHAILVFVNKTDGTAAIHMTSDNSAPSSKANNDYIKFTVANNQYEDVAYAWFDKGEGLKKINHRNSEVPMVYIPQGDVNYSIATMADNTKAFNLNFKAMTTGKYTLSYKTQGEFNYMHIYDRLTGEDVDMLLEGEYSFIGSPNDNDARFIVRLGYAPDYDSEDSFVYQNGNDIIVNGEGELQIFDVTGRMVKNTVINGIETITMPQGVYIFRLNENIQKIVVR